MTPSKGLPASAGRRALLAPVADRAGARRCARGPGPQERDRINRKSDRGEEAARERR